MFQTLTRWLCLGVIAGLFAAPVHAGGKEPEKKKDGSLDLKQLEELQKELEKARKELKDEKTPMPPPVRPDIRPGDLRGMGDLQLKLREALERLGRPGLGGLGGRGGLGGLPLPLMPLPGARLPKGDALTSGGRLGISLEPPSDVLRDQLGLPADQGLVITRVVPGSAADKAGLKVADIVIAFAGQPVPSQPEKLKNLVDAAKAGAPLDVEIMRKGKRETLKGLTLPETKTRPRLDVSAPRTVTINNTINSTINGAAIRVGR